MKAFLLAGASALILTIAAVSDASANPKNKFSDGSIANVDISSAIDVSVDGSGNGNDVAVNTTNYSESFNVDTEVLGTKIMNLTVSGNSVVVSADGGNGVCVAGGAGCFEFGSGNLATGGNGGSASANTGNITFGSNTFDHFGGLNSVANNTGNNVAQVADIVMPVNAVVNFRSDCCSAVP